MSETPVPVLNSSILVDVGSACGVDEADRGFDHQLIPLINSQMMMAYHQLGIGHNGFNITGINETWADWLGEPGEKLAAIKTWLGYQVLLLFDPPDNGSVLKAYQDSLAKMEWMLASKSHLEGYAKTVYPTEYVEED